MVDLVNLQTTKDIVYIQTEYRQSTDTSAPTNSPLAVALSLSSMVVDSSWTSTVFGLRVIKTLMSFQVFNVGGSSKSSRLESRECINKLPVSCRKCVDKLPLNISSPLSYAREKTLSLWSEILVVLMMASGNSIIFIFWAPSRRVFIPELVIDYVLPAFRICTCKKSKRVMRTTAWNSQYNQMTHEWPYHNQTPSDSLKV